MTNKKNAFTPDAVIFDGDRYPATWTRSSTGRTVYLTYTIDGDAFRLWLSAGTCEALYRAALQAMDGDTVDVDGETVGLVMGTAKHVAPRPERTEAEAAAKQRHGDVPEMLFIGTAIEGKTWRILFDGDTQKTRVIFRRVPSAAVRSIVKDAGFYWSPSLGSWNKGLNHRAFRAALDLKNQLIKAGA